MYEENEREISWNAEPGMSDPFPSRRSIYLTSFTTRSVPEAMYPPTSSAERDVSWIEQPSKYLRLHAYYLF